MRTIVRQLIRRLGDQSRSVQNARTASTELARRRVEQQEVEIFLDRLGTRFGGAQDAS